MKYQLKSRIRIGIIGTVLFLLFPVRDDAQSDTYDQLVSEGRRLIIKESDQAEKILVRAAALQPMRVDAHLWLGVLHSRKGEFEHSAQEFRRSIELCKNQEERYSCLTTIEAITQLVLSQEELDLKNRAFQHIEDKQPKMAIPLLESAIKLNPGNALLYYELGYAWIELRDFDQAIAHLETGRLVNPFHKKILTELAYSYSEIGESDQVRQVIHDRLLAFGDSPELRQELGFAYINGGKVDSAVIVLEELLETFPDYVVAYYSLGDIHLNLKRDTTRAIQEMEHFLERAQAENPRLPTGTTVHLDSLMDFAKTVISEGSN